MSDDTREALSGLLREGLANYLDALYALHRFKREVTNIAISVWNERRPQFLHAFGIEGVLPSAATRYCNPDGIGNDCDGSWAWVTSNTWFPEPLGGANWYLGLLFQRNELGELSAPRVICFCRPQRAPVFRKLKAAFRTQEHYWTSDSEWECGFSWELKSPLELQKELGEMMDHVTQVWTMLGGWPALEAEPLSG